MADEPSEPRIDEPVVDQSTADDVNADDVTADDVNVKDVEDVEDVEDVDGDGDGRASTMDGADEGDPVDEADGVVSSAAASTETGVGAPVGGTKAAKPEGTVVRKKVTSKRVTPKGAPQGVKVTSSGSSTGARASGTDDDDASYSKRYTPPKATYAPGPSPWWVPALMFGLLIVGAVVIMANYMGAFGEAQNIRLVIGLAFILGGIITATQYR